MLGYDYADPAFQAILAASKFPFTVSEGANKRPVVEVQSTRTRMRTPLILFSHCITGRLRDLTTEGIEPNSRHPCMLRLASSRRSRAGRVC